MRIYRRAVDHTGRQFGSWTVVRLISISPRVWECRCACGTVSMVRGGQFVSGHSRSCGHAAGKRRHAHSRLGHVSRTYTCWANMMQRCTNPKFTFFKNYGGRGIRVCERWKTFDNFLSDMGEKPEGLTLERINNDGHYEPTNCKWASRTEQGRNRRTNKAYEFNGKPMSIRNIEREAGVSRGLYGYRLRNGWTFEQAISEPPMPGIKRSKRNQCTQLS